MTPNLNLPYRWLPSGTEPLFRQAPDPGSLVALGHAVWRVIEVAEVPPADWTQDEREYVARYHRGMRRPYRVVLRPAGVVGDDPRSRDRDVHLRACGASWHVYPDDHYPMCASCAEPLPCREQMASKIAAASVRQMDRYSMPGVCPACEEPVTSRQKSLTLPDNLEIPGGPPVTFHAGRVECRYAAREYEKRWVSADPKRRRTTLSCPGHVINHGDGTYECSELVDCRGPQATHPAYTVCRCRDCHARGSFGCTPGPDAQLLRRDAA